jgi:RNA recognition motif-containing protein
MGKRLFVGGLPWATTQESLQQHFSQAGTVESAVVITDRMTGRSKGFGFVEMSTEEEAQKAVEMFDGKELEGRQIAVSMAKPREERA